MAVAGRHGFSLMLYVYMGDPEETVEREAKEEKKSLDKFSGFGFRV